MFLDRIHTNIVKQNSVSFNGHNLVENDFGEKMYKFFLPKVYFDNAQIKLKKFTLDANGNIDESIKHEEQIKDIPKDTGVIEIKAKDFGLTENEVLGYKFIIDNNEFLDTHKFTVTENGEKYNIADNVSTNVLTGSRMMYHIMPNIFNPKNHEPKTFTNSLGETITVDEDKVRSNHITKFDADLKSIIEKIPYIKEMGFKRIISTPIFGQDNISTHGYWTINPYQITSRFGNINDFRDLQIEMFKNGMGYIVDGAFTGEGVEGIHVRDLLENGVKSPYLNYFETYNFPSEAIRLGVLPDNEEAYKNFEIRIVNSPVIWEVDKNGKVKENFGQKNPEYDSKKRTFIQLYDKRLASTEQLKEDKLIRSYDIKNPSDVNAINSWMDVVQPFAFPVPPEEVKNKVKHALNDKNTEAKEFLKSWRNFDIIRAKGSSGIKLLTGDKDILKLRYTYPVIKRRQTINSGDTIETGQEEMKKIQEATHEVREYTIRVGEYWTNKTSKILNEYIVSQLKDANNAKQILEIINNKAGKDLPDTLKTLNITEKNIQDVLDNKNPITNYIPYPETIEEMLEETPIESIEVSDEIISLVSSKKAKANLKEYGINKLFETMSLNIINDVQNKGLDCGFIIENGEINPKNYKLLRFLGDDIKKFLFIKALSPKLSTEDIIRNNDNLFQSITLKGIGVIGTNINEKLSQLSSVMKTNLSNISAEDIDIFSSYLNKKIKHTTSQKIAVADYIIDKTEAGLDWRIDASKDIAEIEELMEDDASVDETWGKYIEFWKAFNTRVSNYNRHAYKIGELTDTTIRFNDITNRFSSTGVLEDKLISDGKFTTATNYNFLFSTLQRIYSGMTEKNDAYNYGDICWLLNKILKVGEPGRDAYLYSGNKNSIVYSHVSPDNHDRQRIAHGFSVNSMLAYNNQLDYSVTEEYQNEAMAESKYYPELQELTNAIGENRKYNETGISKEISQENLAMECALGDSFYQALINNKENAENIRYFVRAMDEMVNNNSPYSQMFYHKNFETNYREIINYLMNNKLQDKELAQSFKLKAEEFKALAEKLEPLVHKEFTKYAIKRGTELAKLLVALPGNPTLFMGDELLETGSESKAKNVYLQNRNRLHWDRLNDSKYLHVQNYQKELSKIFNLRNDKDLSCLIDGDTIVLSQQPNVNCFGLYRYNDKNDAIILINKNGFSPNRRCEFDVQEMGHINLGRGIVNELRSEKSEVEAYEIGQTGIPNTIKAGTVFVDVLNPNRKYIVDNTGNICGLDNNNQPTSIILDSSVIILKREKTN